MVGNLYHAEHGNTGEPNQGDGAKKFANARGATLLHHKQTQQHHQGDGNDEAVQGRRYHLQTLHGGQHRDGRRDHAIAIKQAGPKNAHQQQHLAQFRTVLHRLRGQRQHRHKPAFAMVVGAQHQCHVLDGHDDGEGPEEDGEDAVDVVGREGHMARAKNLFHGVQDAGSDVAVDNADGAERERRKRRFGC